MNDDLVRLPVIGQILRRRWRLLAVLAAVGAMVGAGASVLFSPGYATSASVLLQGPRETDEIVTQTQIAMSSVVLDRTAAALAWGVSGADLKDSVSAEAIDGNVIEVNGTAESPERAQQLADVAAGEYVTFSTQLAGTTGEASTQLRSEQRELLQRQVSAANDRISELHEAITAGGATVESVQLRTELESMRTSLREAVSALDEAAETPGRGDLIVMGPAPRPTDAASPTMFQFVAGGTLLFFLLGIAGHLAAYRADRRLRHEPDIAAALGTRFLGNVDVADVTSEPSSKDQTRSTGWGARLRELVHDDRPWDAGQLRGPVDEVGQDIRYRRVLTRLGNEGTASPYVLVLVPADDAPARRAAVRLARTAEGGGRGRVVLRVVDFSPARPTVPDGATVAGVLVMLTAGSRTAWELVGIAEACADAGHQVLGAVVAHRCPPTRQPSSGPSKTASKATVDGDVMAGSS